MCWHPAVQRKTAEVKLRWSFHWGFSRITLQILRELKARIAKYYKIHGRTLSLFDWLSLGLSFFFTINRGVGEIAMKVSDFTARKSQQEYNFTANPLTEINDKYRPNDVSCCRQIYVKVVEPPSRLILSPWKGCTYALLSSPLFPLSMQKVFYGFLPVWAKGFEVFATAAENSLSFFLQLLAPYFAIFLTFDIANCINKELGKLINFLICLREERGCNFPFAFPFQIPQPFSLMLCSLCSLRIAEICVWKTAQSDKERLWDYFACKKKTLYACTRFLCTPIKNTKSETQFHICMLLHTQLTLIYLID